MYIPVCHKGQLRLHGEVSSQKYQTCSYTLDHKKMLQYHSEFVFFFKLDVNDYMSKCLVKNPAE